MRTFDPELTRMSLMYLEQEQQAVTQWVLERAMSESFAQHAYEILTESWGVDGDSDLLGVADRLEHGDTRAAIRELDYAIGCVRARLRAYLTLRAALVAGDPRVLEAIKDKDVSDIDDWTERVEV